MKSNDDVDVREIRRKLGLNQSQFWSKIGVTQSGGSRTRAVGTFPARYRPCYGWCTVEQIDIGKIKKEDLEVTEYLRASNPSFQDPEERGSRVEKEGTRHEVSAPSVPTIRG